jgi:hypothetical protein
MAGVATELRASGHEVTARWIRQIDGPAPERAVHDLADIVFADALVLFTENLPKKVRFSTRGDRHVAFGYALKAGRKLFVVGPQESLFHGLPNVLRFDEVDEMIRYLAEFGSGRYPCEEGGR